MVAVAEGVKLTIGDGVKVGVSVRVWMTLFVLVGMVVLKMATAVGGMIVFVSESAAAGTPTAQPVNVTRLINHTV